MLVVCLGLTFRSVICELTKPHRIANQLARSGIVIGRVGRIACLTHTELSVIPVNPKQDFLRLLMALVSRFPPPFRGLCRILLHTLALAIASPKFELRFDVTRRRQLAIRIDPLFVVLRLCQLPDRDASFQ